MLCEADLFRRYAYGMYHDLYYSGPLSQSFSNSEMLSTFSIPCKSIENFDYVRNLKITIVSYLKEWYVFYTSLILELAIVFFSLSWKAHM